MKVEFRSSFARDLRNIKEHSIKQQIREVITAVETAPGLSEVPDLKKLSGGGHYYRIRIGDYRISLAVESNVVVFLHCLPPKDIYRYFP